MGPSHCASNGNAKLQTTIRRIHQALGLIGIARIHHCSDGGSADNTNPVKADAEALMAREFVLALGLRESKRFKMFSAHHPRDFRGPSVLEQKRLESIGGFFERRTITGC